MRSAVYKMCVQRCSGGRLFTKCVCRGVHEVGCLQNVCAGCLQNVCAGCLQNVCAGCLQNVFTTGLIPSGMESDANNKGAVRNSLYSD